MRDEIRGAIFQDIQRGRYLKPDLIRAMVAQAVQFRIDSLWIEGTNGAHYLYDEIISALQLAGRKTTRVEFIPVQPITDAKALRFKSIYDALKNDELWLALGPDQAAILHELTRPRGKKHDDVSDALGHLLKKLQEPIASEPKEAPASQAQIILQEKMLRELVYGLRDPNGLPVQ